VTGLAIESATEHVEVRVEGGDGVPLAHVVEDVGHGHTRRLTPLVRAALDQAGVKPGDLKWVAADLGPGSFTGVRVGLATAHALAMVAGAELLGASSLAALALAFEARRSLIVPLVPAGRRDVYAGFFRGDARGETRLFAAPCVGPPAAVLERVAEARRALGDVAVRFVGPGAAREHESLAAAEPESADSTFRADGLSAADLARAARSSGGRARGLPAPGESLRPTYVRPAQAEERVRRRALGETRVTLRPMTHADLPAVAAIERRVFLDPWPQASFEAELRDPAVHARIAEREGRLAGYAMTWLGAGHGHLGNLAVAPDQRRRGVATALLDDLLERARIMSVQSVTLEVRVSNSEAQALYRSRGFRVAGLRHRYYRDGGEDALVMEWRVSPSLHQPTEVGSEGRS